MNKKLLLTWFVLFLVKNQVNGLNNLQKELIQSLLVVERSVVSVEILDNCGGNTGENLFLSKKLDVPIKFYSNNFSMNQSLDMSIHHRKLFVMDFSICPQSKYIFLAVDKAFLQFPFRWVIFTDDLMFFEQIPALLASNIILAMPRDMGDGFELKQVYKIKKYSKIQIENYGYWTKSEGLIDQRITPVISRRRKNMKGEILIATMGLTTNASIQHLYNYRGKQFDLPLRVVINQMYDLINLLNSTNRFILTSKFGYNETGIWVGANGDLINEHADLCVSPFFLSPERLHLEDFVGSIIPFKSYFVFRAPRLSSVANIYTLPFSKAVWFCCGIISLLITISLYILFKSEDKLLKNSQNVNVSDTILLCVSAICQMGSVLEAKMVSTKILTLCLFVSFVFIFTSFTASIVALLQSTTKSIQTIQDLYNSEFQLGIEDKPYYRFLFSKPLDGIEKKVYDQKITPKGEIPHYVDVETGVSLLRKGMYGLYGSDINIYREIELTFQEHEKCGIQEIEFMQEIPPYQALKKNSPLKEIIKVNLLKLREHGISRAEINRLTKTRPVCVAAGQQFESVTFKDCYGAVIVLVFGFVFSLIIFLIELLQKIAVKRFQVHPTFEVTEID